MCSDITNGARPRFFGVHPPICLFVIRSFAQPILRIFRLNHSNFAQFAVFDQFARLPDHRITGVIMRENKMRLRSPYRGIDELSLFRRGRQGFITNHVNTRF